MKSIRTRSGQILLVGVLLFLVLMITIPALIYVNQMGTKHGTTSQKRLKARAIAEEGTAYAIQQLTAGADVRCFLYPHFSPSAPTPIQSSVPGLGYEIKCTNGPESYQSTLTVIPVDFTVSQTAPPPIAGASIATVVSARTIGVKLPSGLAVSAATQLGHAPDPTNMSGDFRVHWGPIVIQDTTTWVVDPTNHAFGMNTWEYPRKYSVGAITGGSTADPSMSNAGALLTRCANSSCSATTDLKEYWSFTSTGFSIPVDTSWYAAASQGSTAVNPLNDRPTCTRGGSDYIPAAPAPPAQIGNGYFDAIANCAAGSPQPNTAYFNNGYNVSSVLSSVYVNGNAEFENGVQIDFKPFGAYGSGALIVTGNLTINAVSPVPSFQQSIRVPPNYRDEYPYFPQWWGLTTPTTTCQFTTGGAVPCILPFRGFLYVQGNLKVTGNSDFHVNGVFRLDDQLTVDAGSYFYVDYDDQVNHGIRIGSFRIGCLDDVKTFRLQLAR